MHKYGESKTIRIMMATVHHVTSSSRLRPGLHWYSYLYQLLVQVTNLVFDFPRQVGQ